jgi:uncharacterized protein
MTVDGIQSMRTIDTVLLKVASRCNLDCSYCYIYHMGDEGWRRQPKLMSVAVVEAVAAALGNQLQQQGTPFSVVLHGGEPLLLGTERLDALCSLLRTALPRPCGVHLQTNGVLLTNSVLDVLIRYDVGISISIDGPETVHDRFRKDHRGRGSYSRVAAAVGRVMRRPDARGLFAGVLAVIDPESDPEIVYGSLRATGSHSLDFLVRDGNWDQLPFGKLDAQSTEYGQWLVRLLTVYLRDPAPPRVRILDDMLRLVLGGAAQKEGVGTTDYSILVVEPDGTLNKNDTLKVAHAEADRFERPWSILTDRLSEFLASDDFDRYYRQQRPISRVCGACPDLSICGGGMVAHRWSAAAGFNNPSIFCADQRYLIGHMRALAALLPRHVA